MGRALALVVAFGGVRVVVVVAAEVVVASEVLAVFGWVKCKLVGEVAAMYGPERLTLHWGCITRLR